MNLNLTERQFEVLSEIWDNFGETPFYKRDAYPARDNVASGARRVIESLIEKGIAQRLEDGRIRLIRDAVYRAAQNYHKRRYP